MQCPVKNVRRDLFGVKRVASLGTWLFWWNSQTIRNRDLTNERTGCVMFTISRDWLRFNFHCFVHIFISLKALYGENTKPENCNCFSANSYWHFHSSCGDDFQTWSIKPTRFLRRRIRSARLNWWVQCRNLAKFNINPVRSPVWDNIGLATLCLECS